MHDPPHVVLSRDRSAAGDTRCLRGHNRITRLRRDDMTRRFMTSAALAALVLAAARHADAQGFGLYEHGACTMAMAGAGVADPCPDGSAIFFNPAGLADIEGAVFTAGA